MEPLLSVCLITYNHKDYISQAIEGVLMQQVNFPIELIIADDFSTDGTREIIIAYQQKHPDLIKLILQKKNIGPGPNWMELISIPKSKYIAYFEGDDYWTDPYKLQKQVDFLEANENYAICFHEVKILKNSEFFNNNITKKPAAISTIEDLSNGNYIHTASSVYRNLFKDGLPGWFNTLNAGDYPLHMLLAQYGKLFFIEEIMSVYRIHDKGIYSNSSPLRLLYGNVHLLQVLKNHFSSPVIKKNLRSQLKNVINILMILQLEKGQLKEPLKCIFKFPALIEKRNYNQFIRNSVRRSFSVLTKVSKSNKKLVNVPPTLKNSYSQCGEDILVQYVFNLRGIEKPSYIDIGANDPFFLSNTALFYENGSRGINIEANPQLSENFKIHRPEDVNLNIGIGNQQGEFDFYVMQDNTLSTFSKQEADFMIENGKELSEIKRIKLTTITNVLDEYFNGEFPDFMSLDVEGLDFEILKTIDFEKSFPKVICVEAAEYSPVGAGARRDTLINLLVSKGYYEYANTNLNAIMVKNEFWFK